MIRDNIIASLAACPGGASIETLAAQCEMRKDCETLGALEVLCYYSPELGLEDRKWKVIMTSRATRILAAIENYAVSSGKRIFRVASALAVIPVHEHPTETELTQALEMAHGRYQLLPNAMIRRNH